MEGRFCLIIHLSSLELLDEIENIHRALTKLTCPKAESSRKSLQRKTKKTIARAKQDRSEKQAIVVIHIADKPTRRWTDYT